MLRVRLTTAPSLNASESVGVGACLITKLERVSEYVFTDESYVSVPRFKELSVRISFAVKRE
jgi:hypothetical protein